jgi:hypothetical protein
MSVKIHPGKPEAEPRQQNHRHLLSLFLVALGRVGIVEPELRLLSGRTPLFFVWSLVPLTGLCDVFMSTDVTGRVPILV